MVPSRACRQWLLKSVRKTRREALSSPGWPCRPCPGQRGSSEKRGDQRPSLGEPAPPGSRRRGVWLDRPLGGNSPGASRASWGQETRGSARSLPAAAGRAGLLRDIPPSALQTETTRALVPSWKHRVSCHHPEKSDSWKALWAVSEVLCELKHRPRYSPDVKAGFLTASSSSHCN